MTPYLGEAQRLHRYLIDRHWDGRAFVGPDVGVRLNYRVGRFVKSYLRAVPWRDSHYYLQAQAYWALANWLLADETVAVQASEEMLARQRQDGSWEYPSPEWAGRVATVEGTWGAIGLLSSFRRTGEERFLAGAAAWNDFLNTSVGYLSVPGGVAANYFARAGVAVPNVSACVLRFLAELAAADVKVDEDRRDGLLSFLRRAQLPSGELPYAEGRDHFQCFQYNAFQCLDLLDYYDVTGDDSALGVVRGLAAFLKTGIAPDGHVYYDCARGRRAVVYHAAAVGAALSRASQVAGIDVGPQAGAAYRWVISQQRRDGGFPFSRREHGVLRDRRSYPRNQAMILEHLLVAVA